jgi:hypothetical protein
MVPRVTLHLQVARQNPESEKSELRRHFIGADIFFEWDPGPRVVMG